MYTQRITWSLLLAGAFVTAACGDSKSSMNPVAPSAVVAGAQSDEAGAEGGVSSTTGKKDKDKGKEKEKGNGNSGPGNGNGGGNQPTVPTAPQPPTNTTPTTTRKVEIEGVVSATGGDSITVRAQEVIVPSTATIRHGQTPYQLSDVHVGDRVHVRAMRTTTGSGFTATTTIEASEVILQNPDGSGDGSGEETTDLVSVSAFDALASETGSNGGTFRLTRSGSAALLALPLTATFTLTGTATNVLDYANVPLTVTFLAGQASADVLVTPVVDATTEGSESVILTLTDVGAYELGAPATATVTITDTDSPLVSVSAFDSTASETGPDMGIFRFSRTGSTAAALTVTFTVAGTATGPADYQTLPVSVTFAAGQATSDVYVIPFGDALLEGSESVIVTITDGASYDLGAPATATVTIAG
jgi:hypothetical protein